MNLHGQIMNLNPEKRKQNLAIDEAMKKHKNMSDIMAAIYARAFRDCKHASAEIAVGNVSALRWFAAAILAVKETNKGTFYEDRPAIFQAVTKESAQEYFLQKAKIVWYPESEGWTNHKVDVIEFPEEAR